MSGHRPDLQDGRPERREHPRLALDIERVLGLSARQTVRAEFAFDPGTPLVVDVALDVRGGPRVLWRIARDLLRQGLYVRSGHGDVQMWPTAATGRATAWLQLASGDMAALFALPAPPLAEWLAHTYTLVPAGQELSAIDWDTTTAELLDDRRARPDVPGLDQ
ncbi:SsgA family sporulation/cell division regulator [Streptomyces sp. NPDC087300]|uniref:SsgA family sporulation/cell division regulator n=1 Tax=Streptomyces sp. NPDC087300 TaxID=3365780 RepID=UPI00382BF621